MSSIIRNPPLIKGIYDSCQVELEALVTRNDLSSYLDVAQLLRKSFLLSCASFYEDEVVRLVRSILDHGNHSESVRSWLNRVAVEGQFYKWFNFRDAKNTNDFLSTFGSDFKKNVRGLLDARESRKGAERDFLDLCKKRNECVHRNYAAYSLDLTLPEIYEKHHSAMSYIRVVDYGAKKWLMESVAKEAPELNNI